MRILIFNWQDIKNPLAGGAEVHLHEVFSRIAHMGHEVTLYCSSFPGAPKEEMLNGIKILREGNRYIFNFLVPIRYFSKFRKQRFDLIVDDMNKIPFFTPMYVREPLYIVTHHMFKKSIFLEASFPIALYVYVAELMGFGLCRSRKIPFIVGSPSTKQELLESGFSSEQVEIINYCVDHAVHVPAPLLRSATPLIGYFGRLKKYKSVDQLLRAFVQIKNTFPDVKLVIVGEGDNRPALESFVHEAGLQDSVTFTGFVSEEEKVRWLQKVWFAVNTSSKEGWGLTVIEANACGTAVVASNVPGLRDAVKDGETGLLYRYGDIDDLSSKITEMLNDESLRNRLAASAFQWASTFDWDHAAEQTLALLEQRVKDNPKA